MEFTGFAELPGATLEVGDAKLQRTRRAPRADLLGQRERDGPVELLEGSGCDPERLRRRRRPAPWRSRPRRLPAAPAGAQRDRSRRGRAASSGIPAAGRARSTARRSSTRTGSRFPWSRVTGEAIRAIEAVGDEPRAAQRRDRARARRPAKRDRRVRGRPEGLMVGAHLDSVLEGPGINDNGSGVAAVLEIARGVAEGGIPDGTAVRIGLWGGEELGLVGSRAYVPSLETTRWHTSTSTWPDQLQRRELRLRRGRRCRPGRGDHPGLRPVAHRTR